MVLAINGGEPGAGPGGATGSGEGVGAAADLTLEQKWNDPVFVKHVVARATSGNYRCEIYRCKKDYATWKLVDVIIMDQTSKVGLKTFIGGFLFPRGIRIIFKEVAAGDAVSFEFEGAQ